MYSMLWREIEETDCIYIYSYYGERKDRYYTYRSFLSFKHLIIVYWIYYSCCAYSAMLFLASSFLAVRYCEIGE